MCIKLLSSAYSISWCVVKCDRSDPNELLVPVLHQNDPNQAMTSRSMAKVRGLTQMVLM